MNDIRRSTVGTIADNGTLTTAYNILYRAAQVACERHGGVLADVDGMRAVPMGDGDPRLARWFSVSMSFSMSVPEAEKWDAHFSDEQVGDQLAQVEAHIERASE